MNLRNTNQYNGLIVTRYSLLSMPINDGNHILIIES
jgi:hypothetical protein